MPVFFTSEKDNSFPGRAALLIQVRISRISPTDRLASLLKIKERNTHYTSREQETRSIEDIIALSLGID